MIVGATKEMEYVPSALLCKEKRADTRSCGTMINSDLYWSMHSRLNPRLNAKQLRKQLEAEEE